MATRILRIATKYSNITEFNGAHDDWNSYTKHLHQYFVGNDVTEAGKKRMILFSSCGAGTYEVIKSLVAPKKPTDHAYAQLVKLVNRLYARYALRRMHVHVIKRKIRLRVLTLLLLCYNRAHHSIVD